MQIDLDPDFAEFVERLARHDVRYLIVGGDALAAHGLPRAAGDFEIDAAITDDPSLDKSNASAGTL